MPSSRQEEGRNLDFFLKRPGTFTNNLAGNKAGQTARPGVDDLLQGRGSSDRFNSILLGLQHSEKFLAATDLKTPGARGKGAFVSGTAGRIDALQRAKGQLETTKTGGGRDNRDASDKLLVNIRQNLRLAQDQRNSVLNVLSEFRARQRAAQRTNNEISSGRRNPRSAGSVIPRLPTLLGAGSRRI